MFSRRARQYIVAYHALAQQKKSNSIDASKNTVMSVSLIENVMKIFKTHRSASDFDFAFTKSVVDTMFKIKQHQQ